MYSTDSFLLYNNASLLPPPLQLPPLLHTFGLYPYLVDHLRLLNTRHRCCVRRRQRGKGGWSSRRNLIFNLAFIGTAANAKKAFFAPVYTPGIHDGPVRHSLIRFAPPDDLQREREKTRKKGRKREGEERREGERRREKEGGTEGERERERERGR